MSETPGQAVERNEIESFYDGLAEWYHLLFPSWERSIVRQAAVLGPLLERLTGKASAKVLDCACGIGTQALGLAQRGHQVTATDLSRGAVARARVEAQRRGLLMSCAVADMRELPFPESSFDAVLIGDNALPHLPSTQDLKCALKGMASTLRAGGVLVATIRDYDRILAERPTVQAPSFFDDERGERFVHQVWKWDGDEYSLHLYLTMRAIGEATWTVKHFTSRYRALSRTELEAALQAVGLRNVSWIEPGESGFFQPIVTARKELSSDA